MTRDLRQYARQTNIRLLIGFVFLLFLVGDGLIYIFFGREAALMGLICLLSTLAPVLMILVALWVIDWIAQRANKDE
jgi:hypothetical protein